jgi:hypothetical protein
MRMRAGAMLLTALVSYMLVLPAHAQSPRVNYIEYKFDDLDEGTRTAISKFNMQLSKFSEGCIAEQDKATLSLFETLAADGTCGVATATALKSKSKLAVATAVIACGWEIPKALRERAEKKENLKTCKELDEMLAKYKENCEGKTRVVFAFEDALYCYSPVNGLSLVILDLKNRTVLIKKP